MAEARLNATDGGAEAQSTFIASPLQLSLQLIKNFKVFLQYYDFYQLTKTWNKMEFV